MLFDDLSLDAPLLHSLAQLGYQAPTAVQAATIPAFLTGEDLLVGAATGTGKTAAYALPILQRMLDIPNPYRQPHTLILAPTRELVFQIQYMFEQLGRSLNPQLILISGGSSPSEQRKFWQAGGDIVIATPGRLKQLIEQDHIDCANLQCVVIDEADRMLDMGLGPEVLFVLARVNPQRQLALFSATLTGSGISLFVNTVMPEATRIQMDAHNQAATTLAQAVYLADHHAHKQQLLLKLLERHAETQALIFCNKRATAEALTHWLQSQQCSAQVLHGDFDQNERRNRLRKFRLQHIKLLVATDIASRGIDLPEVGLVINFELPYRGDTYIHRVGRTGRSAQAGSAVSLVEPYEIDALKRIEHHLQHPLPIKKIKGLAAKGKVAKTLMKQRSPEKPRYITKAERPTSAS